TQNANHSHLSRIDNDKGDITLKNQQLGNLQTSIIGIIAAIIVILGLNSFVIINPGLSKQVKRKQRRAS
ncbi:MAG: hypothetical protein ACKO7W_19030, partial [Elainella sp.]